MAEGSPPPQHSPDAPAPATGHRRLARLFGESLFGPWLDPADLMPEGHRRRRRRGRLGKRLVIAVVAVAVLGGGVWLTRRGLARQAEQERARVATDVAAFLAEGELERLAQFLALLAPPDRPLSPTDPNLEIVLAAEAALYRYHDAAPARLARVETHAARDSVQPRRLLAYLTVASRDERVASYDRLVGMVAELAKDPEYRTLMATVQEARGDVAAARQSWERSAQAGPLWLPHRYLQCAFEARQKGPQAVARLLQHMARVAPTSPWTRLALLRFSASPSPAPAGPLPPSPPVVVYQTELGNALADYGSGDRRGARQALERGLGAVGDQPVFVLDCFDALVDGKAGVLASELAELEAWPRGNPIAQAKLATLSLAVTPPRAQSEEPAQSKPAKRRAVKRKAASKPSRGRGRR